MARFSFAGARIADKWLITIAVTLGMFMSLLDHTIVNVAIPQMQRAFGADIHSVQWIVTVYMLTQAAVIPIAPYLTRRFGEKRAYVWTLTAFLLGSVLCGFAWNLPSLIFFRFIQGIGGGILLPLVQILLYQAFSTEERGMAMSMISIPLMVAPLLGPVFGGYLITYFGWPWAFFINVPLGIIAVVIAQKVLRPTPAQQRPRLDLAGFLTVAVGSALLLYALSEVTNRAELLKNLLIGGVGGLLLVAFVLIEQRNVRGCRESLLDLRRFSDRGFTWSVVALVFLSLSTFGVLFLTPLYLQVLHQESALQAGAIQGVQALATLLALPIAGRLSAQIGSRPVAITGIVVLAGATTLLLTLGLATQIWIILGILILLGVAGGLTGQIPVVAMQQIEKEQHREVANGSTIITVLRSTAAPMGVALLSGIVESQSLHYRLRLAAQGVSGDALNQQSTLLAMHLSFGVAALLALAALAAMCLTPKRQRSHALSVALD